jgi:hypothetical protein
MATNKKAVPKQKFPQTLYVVPDFGVPDFGDVMAFSNLADAIGGETSPTPVAVYELREVKKFEQRVEIVEV